MPDDIAVLPAQVSPPQFALSPLLPTALRGADVIALAVLPGDEGEILLGPGAVEAEEAWGIELLDLLEVAAGGEATTAAEAGSVTSLGVATPDGPALLLLVGIGDASPAALRRAGAALGRATKDREALVSAVAAAADGPALQAFVVGMMLGSFSFDLRADGPAARPVARVVLAGQVEAAERDADLARALAVGGAAWRARTLATVPANLKNPAWLAAQAEDLAAEAGLDVSVWDERELAKRGMGGILAVGAASESPPRLIRLDYTPAKVTRKTPRVVIVGKGITFDSGGLSIKPGESMVTMKRDMTGGAVVMGVLGALAAVGCPIRVTGLIPAAENAIGGSAMRPGDVITHYGGRTTEVTNTDAEGRLVMADALAYADAELDPAVLIDVATLTGGIKVALGQSIGGLFATDDWLGDVLVDAGRRSGEPLWPMPLARTYDDKLASKIADADNAPGGPAAIVAALFLRHFVGDRPWAHLDVASVGDARVDAFEWTSGPTGFGTRVLLAWLGAKEPLAGLAASTTS